MSKPAPTADDRETVLECTPDTYRRVFETSPDGQLVLAALCRKFYRDPYVKGGEEARRETDIRIGENRVLIHILNQIGKTTEASNESEE